MTERLDYSLRELAAIEHYFRTHPQFHQESWTLHVVLRVMVEKHGILYLDQIEVILRKLDSPVFLLAMPASELNNENLVARLPQTGEQEYPYYLFTFSTTNEEVQAGLLTPLLYAENLLKLRDTGILTQREPSVPNGI